MKRDNDGDFVRFVVFSIGCALGVWVLVKLGIL